jgi:hypothetical protein
VLAEDTPGLDLQLPMPSKPTDQTLLTTGRKFARDAEPFSSQLVAHGMPVAFLNTNAVIASGLAAVRSLTPSSPTIYAKTR